MRILDLFFQERGHPCGFNVTLVPIWNVKEQQKSSRGKNLDRAQQIKVFARLDPEYGSGVLGVKTEDMQRQRFRIVSWSEGIS